MESTLSERLRAWVVEVLQLIADPEEQLTYLSGAEYVSGGHLNRWQDVYTPGGAFDKSFTELELAALREYDTVQSQVADATPDNLPSIEIFQKTQHRKKLSDAARRALVRLGEISSQVVYSAPRASRTLGPREDMAPQ
jgi:hypothetical protein